MVTEEEIEAARTPAGGWTREQLAAWGVPWPPPKGWKKVLIQEGSFLSTDDLVADVARRLSESSSLDYATAWNLLNPPNGALAPVMAELMCRRQEIKALLDPLRQFVDGHALAPDEREYCVGLLESLAPD